MPATPAWPPKSLPRLYMRQPLSSGVPLNLDPDQANYLGNVMRLGVDAQVLLFDGASGEWLGRVAEAGKKRMTLLIEQRTREPEQIPDVWIAFAPVKRTQTDWLVEKATELGAARLLPVITQRTIAERVKIERLRTIAIEAAEQCGRTRLPDIAEPVTLKQFLAAKGKRPLYFADENGGDPVREVFRAPPATLLVGPEGGFTDEERTTVRAAPGSTAISLGPRILRAETAALAGLAAFMAIAGDWSL